jgi:hypothetical protein
MVRCGQLLNIWSVVVALLSAPAAAAPSHDLLKQSRFHQVNIAPAWWSFVDSRRDQNKPKHLIVDSKVKPATNPYQALLDKLERQKIRQDDFELWYGLRAFSSLCYQVESILNETKQLGCGKRLRSLVDLLFDGYKPFTMRAYIQGLATYCRQLKSIQQQLGQKSKPRLHWMFYRWAARCRVGVQSLTMSTW